MFNLLLGVLGVHFIHHPVMMFHIIVVLGLNMTNQLLMEFLFILHLLVVFCMDMTDHLLMKFFCVYILLGVLGLDLTDHLLMIALLQLTFILVKEHQ